MDEKFQRDEDRRAAERDRKAATNSTDRGAYVMASKVHEQKTQAIEEFFNHNQNSVNLLNKTLQNSEKSKWCIVKVISPSLFLYSCLNDCVFDFYSCL